MSCHNKIKTRICDNTVELYDMTGKKISSRLKKDIMQPRGQWFSKGVEFSIQGTFDNVWGHLTMSGDIFGCHN